MSVIVQRHGDVGMSHDVLQVFGVHSSLGKPSAESVPHGMGRDVRQGLIRLVVLVVLPDKPLEHALVAGRRFGKAALVEEQEVGVTPDIDRGGLAPVLHSPLQRLIDLLAHGDLPHAILGLGRVHIVAEFAVPQKLVVHIDPAVLKIQLHRQAAQLGDAETGPQQDDDLIAILPVDRVAAGEGQEAVLLFLGQRDFFLRVILQDRVHSEVERVFSDAVILNRRVKGRFQRPFPVVDGLVGIALLAHPDGPFLGVRELYRVNASGAQGVAFQNGHQVFPTLLSAPLDILPMAVLPGIKLADRHLLADGVDPIIQVSQDLLDLLTERDVIPLARGGLVGGDQFPGIHELSFTAGVRVLVSVSSVFSLALSSS